MCVGGTCVHVQMCVYLYVNIAVHIQYSHICVCVCVLSCRYSNLELSFENIIPIVTVNIECLSSLPMSISNVCSNQINGAKRGVPYLSIHRSKVPQEISFIHSLETNTEN